MNGENSAQFLLTIGGILLLGLLTSTLARRSFLPRVTLLLIFGALIGPQVADWIPSVFASRFQLIADMTLLVVGFLLGGKLQRQALQHYAGPVLWISLTAALLTALVVATGLVAFGVGVSIAVLLACIAAATAPASVLDVVTEAGQQNRFSRVLLLIVALDDVWALLLFGVGMAVVTSINGAEAEVSFLLAVARELGGAVLLGILVGIPAALFTGRIKPGQPILAEALGIVFVCGGLALWLDVSYLIAAIVMGAVIANLAKHHDFPFHAIEGVEWPFMVVFFVLAGASLEWTALSSIGLVGVLYIVLRAVGKILGAGLGAKLGRADAVTRKWMGLALLPQAGVAIGMALVASNQFPEFRQVLLSVVVSSTVFFEIIGPVFTRLAIRRAQIAQPVIGNQ